LAGDVGGTKTDLALFDKDARGRLTMVRDGTLRSADFVSLELAIERFLDGGPRSTIAAACLGVAGPVVDGRCQATNLPWVDGERRLVIASEGGHGDLAARNELEDDLLRYLRKEFGRVSYERVLAGPGLYNVYRFLRDTGWAKEAPEVAERMRTDNPSAVVTE